MKKAVDSLKRVHYNTKRSTCTGGALILLSPDLEDIKAMEVSPMSTFMANKGNIVRKWYILDAAGKPLGKTAATAATLLRGKHKPEYTPHADCGDFVIIINAEKAVLTGKKGEQKYYRTHSGYPGGLKETKYRILMQIGRASCRERV